MNSTIQIITVVMAVIGTFGFGFLIGWIFGYGRGLYDHRRSI